MRRSSDPTIAELERQIEIRSADPGYPHDPFLIEALREAITSAKEGNFGVGAVLVNEEGVIIQRGRNRVFYPYFRSDLHAEMDLMTKAEEQFKDSLDVHELTLFSSLEPCPMCLTRLIVSGVGKVYHAATDEPGGMVTRLSGMPPEWQYLAEGQEFGLANCSPGLQELAWRVFEATVEVNDRRLKVRARSLGRSKP